MRFSEDRIEKLSCSNGVLRDIHIWEHENPRAVFITFHGLMDHGGNYLNPGLYLKERGFALVAHDQHGHDRKRRAHVPRFDVFLEDLQRMLTWVEGEYPEVPVFIMGHSMGGLIVTHFGIRYFREDPQVKGFILSAPAYATMSTTHKVMIAFSNLLSVFAPRMKVPLEDIRMYVTRDEGQYYRMRQDEKDGIQATEITVRMGAEFMKAQKWVPGNIDQWSHPVLVIVPGEDKLADSEVTLQLISRIDKDLVTIHRYPENYHESFNELNREKVFASLLEWCEPRIK